MEQNIFIESLSADEQGRVVVVVKEQFHHFLKEDMVKSMLKDVAVKALGDKFIQLEVSPSTFRVTVTEGATEEAKTVIQDEISKNIEMALNFLSAMNQS